MTASSLSCEPYRVPAGGRVHGRLAVPPSKSVTHRYLNLALLAAEPMLIERPLLAEDTRLFLNALESCGWAVEERGPAITLDPRPSDRPAATALFCGNAGTMFRFLVAALTTVPGEWVLDGVERLRERPVGPLVDALRTLGAEIECLGREGFAPLKVLGRGLAGGRVELGAGESSQYLSALLMAATRARGEVEIAVRALVSAPYVELTLELMAERGAQVQRLSPDCFRVAPGPLHGGRVRVEGDYSAACYPAAAAALTGGRVVLSELRPDSRQGDRRFFSLLAAMGAKVSDGPEGMEVEGRELVALDVDLSDLPDQVPTLAALAPFARGTTRIRNVAHLRIKESDRLAAMAEELRKLAVPIEEGPDGLVIDGVWALKEPPSEPVVVEPHGDHRIAMSLALVGLRRPGVAIRDPQVVEKSYPGFWADLASLLST